MIKIHYMGKIELVGTHSPIHHVILETEFGSSDLAGSVFTPCVSNVSGMHPHTGPNACQPHVSLM